MVVVSVAVAIAAAYVGGDSGYIGRAVSTAISQLMLRFARLIICAVVDIAHVAVVAVIVAVVVAAFVVCCWRPNRTKP